MRRGVILTLTDEHNEEEIAPGVVIRLMGYGHMLTEGNIVSGARVEIEVETAEPAERHPEWDACRR